VKIARQHFTDAAKQRALYPAAIFRLRIDKNGNGDVFGLEQRQISRQSSNSRRCTTTTIGASLQRTLIADDGRARWRFAIRPS
jgi:hypothetical protein